jgi:hypothetical protein
LHSHNSACICAEQFGADYQPQIASHGLVIEFGSDVDTQGFRDKVLPSIQRFGD